MSQPGDPALHGRDAGLQRPRLMAMLRALCLQGVALVMPAAEGETGG